jgi:hypothetical protein
LAPSRYLTEDSPKVQHLTEITAMRAVSCLRQWSGAGLRDGQQRGTP